MLNIQHFIFDISILLLAIALIIHTIAEVWIPAYQKVHEGRDRLSYLSFKRSVIYNYRLRSNGKRYLQHYTTNIGCEWPVNLSRWSTGIMSGF
jgi:hypothetical protein